MIVMGGPFLEMTEKVTTDLESGLELRFPKLG